MSSLRALHPAVLANLAGFAVVAAIATHAGAAHAEYPDDQNGGYDDSHDKGPVGGFEEGGDPRVGMGLRFSRGTEAASDLYRSDRPGMYDLDISVHTRFSRRLALEFGMNEAVGSDPNGFRRYDLGWTLPSVVAYFNTESRTQLYGTFGFSILLSHYESNGAATVPRAIPWAMGYMGAFTGIGVETRLEKNTALRFELRGFMRGRLQGTPDTEAAYDNVPSFSDATKTQRGVMLSAGFVFF